MLKTYSFDVPFAPLPDWITRPDFTEEREDSEEIEEREDIEDSEAIRLVVVVENIDDEIKKYINTAIKCTLPGKEGYRNFLIFQFCRWLKGNPDFEKLTAGQLKPLVKMWYEQALSTIGTKVFDETWADFCYGWKKVKYPKGGGMLKVAIQSAINSQNCIAAEKLYEKPEIKLLVRICFELQKLQENEPFWLACNDGARILCVSAPTVTKWLSMLEADNVIRKTKEHTNRLATRYRFISN